MLQPVERRLAGQWGAGGAAGCKLAGEHRQHRVVAQLVVVDQVLIAERKGEHPLADKGVQLVLDQLDPPLVAEAAGERLTSRIARSVAPSSSAPASEVTSPP